MRGETFSETKDQLSTATFDKVGRLYSSSILNAFVVLASSFVGPRNLYCPLTSVTDARIETKLSRARQGESEKNGRLKRSI